MKTKIITLSTWKESPSYFA